MNKSRIVFKMNCKYNHSYSKLDVNIIYHLINNKLIDILPCKNLENSSFHSWLKKNKTKLIVNWC